MGRHVKCSCNMYLNGYFWVSTYKFWQLHSGLAQKMQFVARAIPSREEISDIELINNLVSNKRGSFEAFYNRYKKLIFHCIRNLSTAQDSEDAFQDFIIKISASNFNVLNQWRRESSLTNYLARIIRNFMYDRYRSQKARKLPLHDGEDAAELGAKIDDPSSSPEVAVIHSQLRRAALQAWSELKSPRDRNIICDKFHREKKINEINIISELRPEAARKAIFDAQKRFMQQLSKSAPELF